MSFYYCDYCLIKVLCYHYTRNTLYLGQINAFGLSVCLSVCLSCTRHKNLWSSTPVLCSESHLIFPWLKYPIIIQPPLLTSLIALCIFSLLCLVMLGQRYTACTTPMVAVVCPVTPLPLTVRRQKRQTPFHSEMQTISDVHFFFPHKAVPQIHVPGIALPIPCKAASSSS